MLVTAVASMPVSARTLKVQDRQGKHVGKITCKAFNGFDESFKPTAVTEAARYARGKLKDETIDVAGIERVTPAVIEGCRANPDHTLVARIRQAF